MITRSNGKTTIFLVLLIIISLGLAGGIFYLFQQEQAKSLKLQDELDETRARYTIAEGKVKESESTIKQLDLQLQDAKSKVDGLAEEVKQERDAKKAAQEELDKVKADLTTQNSLRVKLESELNLAQVALKKAQAQLKDIEGKKDLLESKIGALEQKAQNNGSDVELGTIIVAPETMTAQAAAVSPVTKKAAVSGSSKSAASEGKVLVVNKEYNFAVINLGSKDGAALGDVFYVYHNNKYIGDVTLEKIHDSMAAAGFTSADIKNKIAEGDRVAKKTK